jgi:hypothetical protein
LQDCFCLNLYHVKLLALVKACLANTPAHDDSAHI